MTIMYQDKLIRQAQRLDGSIYTVRNRVSKTPDVYTAMIRDWLLDSNGHATPVLKKLRNLGMSHKKASRIFKNRTGIERLCDRHIILLTNQVIDPS